MVTKIDDEVPPNLRVIENGGALNLKGLKKKKKGKVGDKVFVPHANQNFCLAEIIQANASAKLSKQGKLVDVLAAKVHFVGWNDKENMYILQDELFEVTKEAFLMKIRVANEFKQPMTSSEVRYLKLTYVRKNFGNISDLDELQTRSRHSSLADKKSKIKKVDEETCTPPQKRRRKSEGFIKTTSDTKTRRRSEPSKSRRTPTDEPKNRHCRTPVVKEKTRSSSSARKLATTSGTKRKALDDKAINNSASKKVKAGYETKARLSVPKAQKAKSKLSKTPVSAKKKNDLPIKPQRKSTSVTRKATPSKGKQHPQEPEIELKKAKSSKSTPESVKRVKLTKEETKKSLNPTEETPRSKRYAIRNQSAEKLTAGKSVPTKTLRQKPSTKKISNEGLSSNDKDNKELSVRTVGEDLDAFTKEVFSEGSPKISETEATKVEDTLALSEISTFVPESKQFSPKQTVNEKSGDVLEFEDFSEIVIESLVEEDMVASEILEDTKVEKEDTRSDLPISPSGVQSETFKRQEKSLSFSEKSHPEVDCLKLDQQKNLCSRSGRVSKPTFKKIQSIENQEQKRKSRDSKSSRDSLIPNQDESISIVKDEWEAVAPIQIESFVDCSLNIEQLEDTLKVPAAHTIEQNSVVKDIFEVPMVPTELPSDIIQLDDSDEEECAKSITATLAGPSLTETISLKEQLPKSLFNIEYNPEKEDATYFEVSPVISTSQLTSAELIEEIEYLAGYYKMLDKATINIRCRVCMTYIHKGVFVRHILGHLRAKNLPILPFSRQYDDLFHLKCVGTQSYDEDHDRRLIDLLPALGFPPRLLQHAKQRIMSLNNLASGEKIMQQKMETFCRTKLSVINEMRAMAMQFDGYWPEKLKCIMCGQVLNTSDIFEHIYEDMVCKKEFIRRHYVNQTHAVFHHAGVCDKMYESISRTWLDEVGKLPSDFPELEPLFKKCSFLETGTF